MSKEIMENDMYREGCEACEAVTVPMVTIPVSRFEELIWSETRFCTLQTMIEEGVELPKICKVFGLDHKKTTGDRLAELFEEFVIKTAEEKKKAKAEKEVAEDTEPETEEDIKAKGWTPVDVDNAKLPPSVMELIEEAKKAHPDAKVSVWTKPVELTHAEIDGVEAYSGIDPADTEGPEEKHFIEIEQDGAEADEEAAGAEQ